MHVMVIGSGGREHALAWKLAQSSRIVQVIVAPGNAGTAIEARMRNVAVDVRDPRALLAVAQQENIALTVVGPEVPLVAGVVDTFRAAGLRIFGPTAAAAQLEGSKAFAKAFMARHKIPTAACQVFTELVPALEYVRRRGAPIVVKADGLAAGKGVVVATSIAQAEDALRHMLDGGAFGGAGARVVIEDFLDGEEASYIVICDGVHALPLATSQDHKRRDDHDRGPNTGGMGAYSPAPVVTAAVERRVLDEIITPTLAGMAADGVPFSGFLYAGLMIDRQGAPRVVEFNARLGDPEAQAIILRLRSDLLDLLEAAVDGHLDGVSADWDPRPALGVVLAAGGYPEQLRLGDPIEGLELAAATDTKVFHAGTRMEAGRTLSSGGRVLTVCALGADIRQAQQRAYAVLDRLQLPGAIFRRDIGHRALARN